MKNEAVTTPSPHRPSLAAPRPVRRGLSRLYSRLAALVVVAGFILPVVFSRASVAQSSARVVAAAALAAADEPAEAAPAPAERSLFGAIKAGGLLMLPIAGCSFIALVFTFERVIALRTGRVIPRPFVKRFMHKLEDGELDRDSALVLCEENGSPVAQVLAHGVKKWGRPAVEVEQALMDGGERAVSGLRRYLRVLNAIATISPLLGLQGTVFGMIHSFQQIASNDALGKQEMLAGGISEALITTAGGLTVAIPALAAYMFFLGRIDRLIMEIDSIGQDLVNEISAEAIAENSRPRSAKARREAA